MFGEGDSESPRVPSPWDNLVSSPPSPSPEAQVKAMSLIPKLVPEAEEGNVEYKLQLLSPSPARFARLVTQLKWRLLEGGGQAYYELGVADSGALVGLPRGDLERSLETLECMAGEIGASVIVVKEITVPRGMSGTKEGLRRWRDGGAPAGETTETETSPELEAFTDASTTDVTDIEDNVSSTAVDTSPALFQMDPEPTVDPAVTEEGGCELPREAIMAAKPAFSVELAISSVFKPRPVRVRPRSSAVPLAGRHKARSRAHKHAAAAAKEGSTAEPVTGKNPWKKTAPEQNGTGHANIDRVPTALEADVNAPTKQQARRHARDRRREERRRAPAEATATGHIVDSEATRPAEVKGAFGSATRRDVSELVSDLEELHVGVRASPVPVQRPPTAAPVALKEPQSRSPNVREPETTLPADVEEERLIVEALVVRKMSLDEAFLDFGGFALVG